MPLTIRRAVIFYAVPILSAGYFNCTGDNFGEKISEVFQGT
jgi:hypothetical protein